jgi:hypothetical protein
MQRIIAVALCAALASSCDQAEKAAPLAPSFERTSTASAPQAAPLVPQASLVPIITVGDRLASGFVFPPIPDGLGAYRDGANWIVYANHELSSAGVRDQNGGAQFRNARVSRLVIDPQTLAVTDATSVVDGSEQYQRLCASTWVGAAEGFPSGYFLTGEESVGGVHDGIQLAIGTDGTRHELPWLGRYAHENLIGVPGFPGRVVLAGFDDNRGASELYLYVAASEAQVISGAGKLYVFKSSEAGRSGDLSEGQTISGSFAEIANPGSLSSSGLQSAVNALGAFPFVRLEDGDYDRRNGAKGTPRIYFVDTGAEAVRCGNVACDAYGSIYRMEFNAADPTVGARLTLLQRSRGADQDWASPDNIASGKNSLMLQEDPAYAGFARAPRIYNFKTNAGGDLANRGVAVVEAINPDCVDALGTCWETSGIIDASEWLGAGAWLFDVQAHTLPVPVLNLVNEGGQVLLLRLPGS